MPEHKVMENDGRSGQAGNMMPSTLVKCRKN